MSQTTVCPGGGFPSASVSGSTRDLTLIAQGPPSATPPLQQRLRALPNSGGKVAVRDSSGNTLVTTSRARQVLRDGQWRNEGVVAERMSAYRATALTGNAQPDPNGYGYLSAERGKMRVITGPNGRVITDFAQARTRASEMIRRGRLTMTSDAEAQTAEEARLRRSSSPRVADTTRGAKLRIATRPTRNVSGQPHRTFLPIPTSFATARSRQLRPTRQPRVSGLAPELLRHPAMNAKHRGVPV